MSTTPELVLVVQLSNTGVRSSTDLAALADALRETAQDLVPGVSTHTLLSSTPVPLVIDLPARDVILDSSRVPLSHTEFEILSRLVRRPRVVVSRSVLRELDPASSDIDHRRGRSVDVHVSRIRTKLGRFGQIITTVRGTGYRFDPDPGVHIVEPLTRRSA
ncbi:winged helix-turn-helix domain-containing protein [Rhodococcus phenolicus]|uniref:winged helix-turn-helix domain-containing protein n=1 Tax=Rhodococcus phenolicus TaxID=263849 RepID=UPI00082C8C77|nr:winged helix-turn-helix domain-containing protein [Rhodococcus phenolicus]